MARGKSWTRDELIVAMNLYCKLPFGQLHQKNPAVIHLAEKFDRTPGSVAMKLCNLASLDPVHQARGVSGLTGASQADREVWAEFHQDWERLGFESEKLTAALEGTAVEKLAEIDETELPREGKERERLVKQRVNQHFFRATVLAAYNGKCCITGLEVRELLVASHVVPWSADKVNRMNPRNGLCLNALHDRAFDRGLITLTLDLKIEVSTQMKRARPSAARFWITEFDGASIAMPERFAPDPNLIAWHRENVFNRL